MESKIWLSKTLVPEVRRTRVGMATEQEGTQCQPCQPPQVYYKLTCFWKFNNLGQACVPYRFSQSKLSNLTASRCSSRRSRVFRGHPLSPRWNGTFSQYWLQMTTTQGVLISNADLTVCNCKIGCLKLHSGRSPQGAPHFNSALKWVPSVPASRRSSWSVRLADDEGHESQHN